MGGEKIKRDGEKFFIGKGGTLEDNIKELESELGVLSKGAPLINGETLSANEEFPVQKKAAAAEEDTSVKEEPAVPLSSSPPAYSYSYPTANQNRKSRISLFKSSKLYIFIFAAAAFTLTVTKAPLFQYTTTFRPDEDIPEMDIAFKYYNNILGKQTRQATLISSGGKTVLVPIPMEQWLNLDAAKKQLVLESYLED